MLLCFIYKYWPHWFDEGRVCFVRTPEFISTNGKKTIWTYDSEEFKTTTFSGNGWSHRHIKGLGSLTEKEYKECIQNPKLEFVTVDENTKAEFEMLFGEDVQLRKNWIENT